MFKDLQVQVLEEFVSQSVMTGSRWDRDVTKSSRVFMFRDDTATQNAWRYWRAGDHLRANRVARYNTRTPEKREHEAKLAKARRHAMTPEQRRAARKPKPDTAEQRAKNVQYVLAHRARKRALTTQTS